MPTLAVAGGYAFWQRLPQLDGNARVEDLDANKVNLWLDEVQVARNGGRAAEYKEEDGVRAMAKQEITVRIDLGRGSAQETVWTTDLSHDYVSINADYRS